MRINGYVFEGNLVLSGFVFVILSKPTTANYEIHIYVYIYLHTISELIMYTSAFSNQTWVMKRLQTPIPQFTEHRVLVGDVKVILSIMLAQNFNRPSLSASF